MEIIIVGNGKLAATLKAELGTYIPSCVITGWKNKIEGQTYDAIIHVGSGREFEESFHYSAATKTPYIQGSTGFEVDRPAINFTYIEVLNGNLLMIKFLHMLKSFGKNFSGFTVELTESHQESKKTAPGTALAIADSLSLDHTSITSVRDINIQKNALKIPDSYLSRHALHLVKISDENNCTVEFKTQILGTDSYAHGFAAIVKAIPKLGKRFYTVLDLAELDLL